MSAPPDLVERAREIVKRLDRDEVTTCEHTRFLLQTCPECAAREIAAALAEAAEEKRVLTPLRRVHRRKGAAGWFPCVCSTLPGDHLGYDAGWDVDGMVVVEAAALGGDDGK